MRRSPPLLSPPGTSAPPPRRNLRAAAEQNLHDVGAAVVARVVQRPVAPEVLRLEQIGAPVQELVDHLRAAALRGDVDGHDAAHGRRVGARAERAEQADNLRLARLRRRVRARVPLPVARVHVRARARQQLDHRELAVDRAAPRRPPVVRRVVKRGPTRAVRRRARRAVPQQKRRHLDVALLRRHVKGLHAERRALRHASAGLEQHAGHVLAAPFR